MAVNNAITVYGGHGRELKRTTFTDENDIVYRGLGKYAKTFYQELYPSKAIIFKQYRKR